MITLRISAKIKENRRVVLTLPKEVPTGAAELLVMIENPAPDSKSLARRSAAKVQPGGCNAPKKGRYPLRGSVISYDRPCDPVAEADWEAIG
jgi:hypothetical protein